MSVVGRILDDPHWPMSLYNFPSPEWECNIWTWWDITLMSRFTLYHKGKGISQVWFRTLTSWLEVNQKEECAWHNQVGSLKKRSRGQSQEVREMWSNIWCCSIGLEKTNCLVVEMATGQETVGGLQLLSVLGWQQEIGDPSLYNHKELTSANRHMEQNLGLW